MFLVDSTPFTVPTGAAAHLRHFLNVTSGPCSPRQLMPECDERQRPSGTQRHFIARKDARIPQRGHGALRQLAYVVPVLLWAGSAVAEECSFARGNLQQYLAWCPSNDGCASEARMRDLAAKACGSAPAATASKASSPTPAQRAEAEARRQREEAEAEERRMLVRDVQDRLNALGHEAGPADGIAGARTAAAIRAFQKAVGMEPDGEITKALLLKLQDGEVHDATSGAALCRQISTDRANYRSDVTARLEAKVSALKEGLDDLRGIQKELKSDYYWTIGDAGGTRELVTYVALATKTTTDLIQGLAGFASESRAASRLIMGLSPEAAMKGVRSAGTITGLYRDTLEKVAFDYALDEAQELNPAARAATTLYRFGENVSQLASMNGELADARSEYQGALGRMEAQVSAMIGKIEAAEGQLEEQATASLFDWWMEAREACLSDQPSRLP